MKEVGFIQLTTMLYQEKDGRWVGECLELGTSNYGNTKEEAETHLEESIALHLNTLEQLGDREKFFRRNNIKIFTSEQSELDVFVKNVKPGVFIRPQQRHLEYA